MLLLKKQHRSLNKFTLTFEEANIFCSADSIRYNIFLCVTGGDWKKARKQKRSPLHILEPVDLNIIFSRAMVVTDSRMAK